MNVELLFGTLAEAATMACCLIVPGTVLLRRLLGDVWHQLPAFRRMGLAMIVSAPILAAFAGLVFALPLPVFRTLGRLAAAVCVLVAFFWMRQSETLRRAWASPWRAPALMLAVFLLAALGSTVVSDLPGPFEEYGDLAAYYRVIDNLSQGREPLVDFRPSDYIGGDYFLPLAYPLPTYLGAFNKTVFSASRHPLPVLAILLGLAGCFICGGRLTEKTGTTSSLGILSASLIPFLPSGNSLALALGPVSLMSFTFAVVTLDAATCTALGGALRRAPLVAFCAVATALTRPEGALLVAAVTAAACLYGLLRLLRRGSPAGRTAAATLLAAGALVAFFTPYQQVLGRAPSSFYLHYFEDTGEFSLRWGTGVFWYHILEDNVREDLGLERQRTRFNPELVEQVRAHPGAYARWLARVVRDRLGWPKLILVGLCVLILGFGPVPSGRILALAAPLYLIVLGAINEMFTARHTLPLITVLAIEAVASRRWLARLWLAPVAPRPAALSPGHLSLAVLLALPLAAFGGWRAYELRALDRASSYNEILRDLRRFAGPESVVASTFPRLIGYGADVKAVGNTRLADTLEAVVEKYSPDFVLLDDARPDLPPAYDAARDQVAGGVLRPLGYRLLVDNPARRYMILQRDEEPSGGP